MTKRISVALFLALLTFTSCKKEEAVEEPVVVTPTPTPSLYTRLGGINAITAVVDQFLANVVADNSINGRFAATVADNYRLQFFRGNLIDQICAGSGGPCTYKGQTMLASHTGLNITDAEFGALVGDLVAALDQFSVPTQEKNDLLAILGPMQTDIVGH